MKRKLVILVSGSLAVLSTVNGQNALDNTATKLNTTAFQTQSTINGAVNTANAVKNGAETIKGVGKMLGFGKKKKTDGKVDSTATATTTTGGGAAQGANDLGLGPNTNATTLIFFDKIEYMQMKQMKDSLSAHKAIADVKTNYNKDGKFFIEIQHKTDSDALIAIILDKWGKNYDVESAEAEKIVMKSK